MVNRDTLPLSKRSDFDSLRKSGKYLRASDWLVANFSQNKKGVYRYGWTISRKVGTAVVRNRLKRWGREYFKGIENNGMDINFIFKGKDKEFFKNLKHQEFDSALENLFRKIQRRH